MFAIVVTLFNSFVRLLGYLGLLFEWLAYWLMQVWGAFVGLVQLILNASVSIFVFALNMITDVLMLLLTLAAAVLPSMPQGPSIGGGVNLGSLNRYLPLGELLSLSTVWAAIFGAIALYKLAKFIRGAG